MNENYHEPQFFLVWREGSVASTPTYKHSSYESASLEAKRLARERPGMKFHVLTHSATAFKADVTFSEVINAY